MTDDRNKTKQDMMDNIASLFLSETGLNTSSDIVVTIGEYKVLKGRGVLKVLGLGSCVGVCIYDPVSKVAGLSHVFLPYSKNPSDSTSGKFADTALVMLINELVAKGARRDYLRAKIAGGANLLEDIGDSFLDIGKQNVQAVEEILSELKIPVIFKDVGGKKGRTLWIDVATCEVYLSVAGEEERKV